MDTSVKHLNDGGLTLTVADKMIENCIGKLSLPLGLGLNFRINGVDLKVPMVVEEPSVIAAASSAAKFIRNNGGGFVSSSTENLMIGQIQLLDLEPLEGEKRILDNKGFLICKNFV